MIFSPIMRQLVTEMQVQAHDGTSVAGSRGILQVPFHRASLYILMHVPFFFFFSLMGLWS